nr:MAG TPA: hypothetical protein [Caudoviricetes sp.]
MQIVCYIISTGAEITRSQSQNKKRRKDNGEDV